MNKIKEQQAQKYAERIAGNTCMAPVITETWLAGYAACEQSMWRSVEDELPKDDETVLTYSSYGHVRAYYSEQDKMWFAYGCYGGINPTHWMQIPPLSLPKQTQDE